MENNDKQAQRARAQSLREQIEELEKGTAQPPQNPNEFVHRRMDELSQEEEAQSEEKPRSTET